MAPAIAWAGVIYAFSSSSSPSIGAVGFEKGQWAPSTVLLHMAEYAILATLLVAGMRLLAARRLGRSVPFARTYIEVGQLTAPEVHAGLSRGLSVAYRLSEISSRYNAIVNRLRILLEDSDNIANATKQRQRQP